MTHDTKQVLKDMMTENTGRHLLDSGDAYGRNFERNQKENIEDRPALTVDLHEYGDDGNIQVLPSVSTYHFLKKVLDYDETAHRLNKQFDEFVDEGDTSKSWLSEMTEWVETQGGENVNAVNTYNEEFNHLDQVLQFVPFTADFVADESSATELTHDLHGDYVILQLHNGADVRGGYTRPVVFKVDMDATRLMKGDYIEVRAENTHVMDMREHEMEFNPDEHDLLNRNEHGLTSDGDMDVEFRCAGFSTSAEVFEV